MYREYQTSGKNHFIFKRIIFSRPILAAVFIILIAISVSTAKTFLKTRKAYLERKEIDEKIENLKLKKNELQSAINDLETKSGIEKELVKKFQIRKPEEKVAVIIEQKGKENQPKKGGIEFLGRVWDKIKNALKSD